MAGGCNHIRCCSLVLPTVTVEGSLAISNSNCSSAQDTPSGAAQNLRTAAWACFDPLRNALGSAVGWVGGWVGELLAWSTSLHRQATWPRRNG